MQTDFRSKETVIKRFNEAMYDLALAIIESRNGNIDLFSKHKKDAGEAISQTLEYALKNHLSRNLTERVKSVFRLNYQNLPTLIEMYLRDDGAEGDYLYSTIDETTNPTVDFGFLKQNKSAVTNASKHEGKDADLNTQIKYIEEVRKFIEQYIDNEAKLKTIQDFDKVDISTWDLFYTACDRFNLDDRSFILVIGPNLNIDKAYLKNLSLPKWDVVIDFDYNSESNGFFSSSYKGGEVSPHVIKASDLPDTNSFSRFSSTHYHFFGNNFKGSGESEPRDFLEWNRKLSRNTEFFLKSYSEVLANQKNIVVILYDSRKHVDFICQKLQLHLGENVLFVFANDPNGNLEQVCKDFNGTRVGITLPQIADGFAQFSSNFGQFNPYKGKFLVPYLESSETADVTGILPAEVFSQLEEFFEVVHKGLPESEEYEDRRPFLSGETKISWYGLKNRFDAERATFAKKSLRQIEKTIESGRGKISLIHEAGFGGTTLARRLAWEVHNDYPTLILKKYKENKVRERIVDLHQRTRKTIFVVMEVPQTITLDEVDSLYRSIPQTRPVVFLIVRRGKPNSNDLTVSDWGNDVSELVKAYQPFLSEYSDSILQERKEKELSELINSTESYKKTPFYVGLITFEERFFALKDYIRNFVLEVREKDEQKKVLAYLSICDDYLGQGLPSSFFKTLFKTPSQDILLLDKYFSRDSSIVDSLLVSTQEGNHKFWKIKHNFFSKELKKQILSGNSDNPEIWKQGLSDYCVKLIEDSVSESNTSDYIQETLQKLFIGNRKDRAGEDFTTIIKDIESIDDREKIFLSLKNCYPDNPHYCSHLARFYAYHNKNRDKALQYADEAIRLSELDGSQDSLLYHIKGMCLRSIAYDEIDKHRNLIYQEQPIPDGRYHEVIEKLIPQAATMFEQARAIQKKQHRLDEYGFIAHIQLLIRGIDYGVVISKLNKPDFFSKNMEPFSEWLDLSETLLEEVRRINFTDDDSGKIEECINEIMAFYENYEQILQNLRNQLDKGKNPSRTRRQIVRTYLRKDEDFYRDQKVISSILGLMEQNIENEPDNETNFYLWFLAARHSKLSIDEALSKFAKWKAISKTIDAIYYFYILKVFRALQGYSESIIEAANLIKECKARGRANITPYEWYGKGNELTKFVNKNTLNRDNKSDKLELVKGYFTEYLHDGNGRIVVADKLDVFFSPTQAKLTTSDLNKEVEFYLGFSYDGLRADSYSVRIKDHEPRNNDPDFELSNTDEEEKELSITSFTDRIAGLSKLGTMKVSGLQKSSSEGTAKRLFGKVVDLQYPPNYVMGNIMSEFGKKYFFHKSNESPEIFKSLKIGSDVSFETKYTEKGPLAFDIKIENKDT